MKTLRLPLFIILTSLFISAGCQRNGHQDILISGKATIQNNLTSPVANTSLSGREPGTCNPNAYIIILVSETFVNGNWEWIWSVQNSNPGNGNNGTIQDLSHWGMQFRSCFIWSSVVSAAYSGNAITWTSFTPEYRTDPSQNCLTTPVLKFDFGTTGSAKSYYKLVVSQDYPAGSVPGYYKSGANTGCCIFNFTGIGCPGGQEE